jgi:hypothetical protein
LTCAIAAAACLCLVAYTIASLPMLLFAFFALLAATCTQTLAPVLHSRFSYTRRHLAKNAFYLLAAFPLQAISSVVLIWLPALLFLLAVSLFNQLAFLFFVCWYGVAGLLSVAIMRKPFEVLEEQFLNTHDENGNTLSSANESE